MVAHSAGEATGGLETLAGRSVLLIIGGGIAAYKTLDLIRRLRERGVAVRAVMTDAAKRFVTPLSVGSLTGSKVHDALFALTDDAEMGHIELSRSADLVVVAPATADLMAKMAAGLADDLASTLLLATDKRVLIAPAMNLRMWLHPATRRNRERLDADGVLSVGPVDGTMACGEYGPGRMSEPLEIVAAIAAALRGDTVLPLATAPSVPRVLAGRRVVVTSGPTHEPIDPVRFIANRSSGRQGHAIAAAAAAAGADVVLISGPVSIPDPAEVAVIRVETAREMLAAVERALDEGAGRPTDVFVAAAAVADWRPSAAADLKIKKRDGDPDPVLQLGRNPDILATVARRGSHRPRLVVGFAAETDRLIAHATAKLERKGCDLIVANDVSVTGGPGVMGGEENEVHLVTRGEAGVGVETVQVETVQVETWPRLGKDEVARRLVARFAALLAGDA